eukprot:2303676-Prymnesium_polylepis.1
MQRQADASRKAHEDFRNSLDAGLASRAQGFEERGQQLIQAEEAKFKKVLESIQIDEPALREQARQHTVDKWAQVLEGADIGAIAERSVSSGDDSVKRSGQ